MPLTQGAISCVHRPASRRTVLALSRASFAVVLPTGPSRVASDDHAAAQDRNRTLVQRLFAEGINGGDEALISAMYAALPDRNLSEQSTALAAADMPVSLRAFRRAAPGVVATVETLVADADLVAARVTWSGFAPPAGTYPAGQTMHLFRIEHDQIVEQWSAGWEWLEHHGTRRLCAPVNPLMT